MEQNEPNSLFGRKGVKLTAALVGAMVVLGGVAVAAGGGHHARMFNKADVNGDDKVSREEFKPFANKRFARFDTDGNGVVTGDEVKAHLTRRIERRQKRLMRRFDADGDGKVTQAEYGERVATMFDVIDKNDDGAITREEAREMRKHWRQRMKRFMDDNASDDTTEPADKN